MPKKTDLQIKMDVLKKLFYTGCVTEKQLQGLEMEDILLIPSITVDEMKELVVLQKCSKKNKLFSYLSGNSETREDENAQSYL
jgi:hypothetical protein